MQGAKAKGNGILWNYIPNSQNYLSVASITGTATAKMNYLQLPIMANVYIAKGLAIKAGIQGGLNVCANYKSSITLADGLEQVDIKNSGKLSDLGIEAKEFVLSVPVGVSYEFHDFVVEGRYNIGISKVVKNNCTRNNVFQLMVGKKIGR